MSTLFSHPELSPSVIVEGLRRMGHGPIGGAGQEGTEEWLRQQTILAVEKEVCGEACCLPAPPLPPPPPPPPQVQLAASYGELSVEEFATLERHCWGALHQHCLQASVQGRGRASLFVDTAAGAVAVVSAVRAHTHSRGQVVV